MLRRGEGDFESILAGSDLIVELMGGLDPAREHVLAALRAGVPVVTANKQLVAQHGDELFDAARENGVQVRYEAAVAGAVPVIRTVGEGLATVRARADLGDRQRHYELHPQRDGRAPAPPTRRCSPARRSSATPRPTRPRTSSGADAAAKMAILARLGFHTPVDLGDVSYEGITEISPDDIAYARELGLSLKLLGVAERHGDEISVRVFPCFLYAGHPLAPVEGPFNAVTIEGPSITEITLSGPGAGGIETASAVLADVVSILAGEAPVHTPGRRLGIARELDSSFYLHLEVADQPGVLAAIAEVLGRTGISVKSVVQRGTGSDARLVMVTHRAPERDFLRGARGDLRARVHARPRPRDPRGRRGVRLHGRADRALSRRARLRSRRPGRVAGGGIDAAGAGAGHLRSGRSLGLPQGRGGEPDRLVQGPGDDGRGLSRGRRRRRGGDLRLDRQHGGQRRRLRGARGPARRGDRPRGQDRDRQARPGAHARGHASSPCAATSTTRCGSFASSPRSIRSSSSTPSTRTGSRARRRRRSRSARSSARLPARSRSRWATPAT